MKKTIIAPVGDFMDDIYVGIREFQTEKVILISPRENHKKAYAAKSQLERFKVPTEIREIKGHLWEEIFKEVARISRIEKNNEILVQVSTGDRDSRCAATSAAFVNGLKAFSVEHNEPMMLPVLKFSYYNLLSDKKMKILRILHECPDCCSSLEELGTKVKMSIPLISYHVNGTLKSQGLKEMGLLEVEERKGRMKIGLSMLGRLLLKGYIN